MARHARSVASLALLALLSCPVHAGPDKSAELTSIVYAVAEHVVSIDRGIKIENVVSTHEQLLDQIRRHVAPETWESAGGPGVLQFNSQSLSLVVRQTPAVHEELRKFLGALQRTGDRQVSIEVRWLQVPNSFGERDEDVAILKWTSSDGVLTAPLTDAQLFALMQRLQGDRRTHIMQMPKITCFSGQAANLEVMDKMSFTTKFEFVREQGRTVGRPKEETFEIGWRARLLPVLSADGRYVHLKAELESRSLIGPHVPTAAVQMPIPWDDDPAGRVNRNGPARRYTAQVQKPAFNEVCKSLAPKIRDGHSLAVLLGLVVQDVPTENRASVLAKIPYLSRLYRNGGWSSEAARLIVVLTPRVLEEDDAEAAPAPVVPISGR